MTANARARPRAHTRDRQGRVSFKLSFVCSQRTYYKSTLFDRRFTITFDPSPCHLLNPSSSPNHQHPSPSPLPLPPPRDRINVEFELLKRKLDYHSFEIERISSTYHIESLPMHSAFDCLYIMLENIYLRTFTNILSPECKDRKKT